jgi:thiamine biosynthesis lipoprotein
MHDAGDLQHEFLAMGSPCLIRVAGASMSRRQAQRTIDAAQAEVARIEARYSRYRADSIVSRINAAAGQRRPVKLDAETAALLQFAGRLHADSGGLFDITSGVLRQAWDFKAARCPTPEQLSQALSRVGWAGVELDGKQVRLPRAGMELDFGGFGKEYAADRAATLLHEAGLQHGYVNLGGDLRVLGPMPDGRAWRLGIAHPRRPGQIISSIELGRGALATSGDYERFFDVDGQRYCHILNPHTGQPVRYWQSVSVLAPACLAAGALATLAMLMQDRAAAFLQAQGVSWMGVEPGGGLVQHELADSSVQPSLPRAH